MPTEVHEHFDAKGKKTGHTVITRESPWNDETRARVLRLAEYEAGLCKCGCGLPMKDAHTDQIFAVDTFRCYANRAIKVASRAADAEAKKGQKAEGWDDGVFYIARPATPKDKEDKRAH